jgi:tetratricopeptide (TPR) repeat protein
MKKVFYLSIRFFLICIILIANYSLTQARKKYGKKKKIPSMNNYPKNILSSHTKQQIYMCGLHFEQGRVKDGRKELQALFSPHSKHLHNLIADDIFPIAIRQHQSGKIHTALELYHYILKYVGNNTRTKANIYANIGLAERDYGNKDRAMKFWKKGLEFDPYHGNILRMTGQLYHEMQYLTSAREAYLKVLNYELESDKLEHKQSDPGILGNLCDLERQLNNVNLAHDYCLQALAINPHTHRAKSSLGTILLQKSKLLPKHRERKELLRKAKKYLGEAITHAPHLTTAWTNYGLILEELEEFDTALKSYKRAIELAPTNPAVYHNIGRYFLMQGKMNEASVHYRKELEIRLKRSTRKCVNPNTRKEQPWSIIKHAWRDIDMIYVLETNKRDVSLDSTDVNHKLNILHSNLELDETYVSDQILFNKTKWHGVAKMENVYMQGRDGIIYSQHQCKVYLGGHRYMAGVKNIGLLGLTNFNEATTNETEEKNADKADTANNNNNNPHQHTIKLKSLDTITKKKMEYANLVSFNSNNYFHFIVETLSRLALFQRYFNRNEYENNDGENVNSKPNIKYVLHVSKPFINNALDLFGLDIAKDVVLYNGADPSIRYFIEDLYIADWFTSSDNTLDDPYVSPTHLFLPPIKLVQTQLRHYILFNDIVSSKWKDSTQENGVEGNINNVKRLHLYVGRKLPLKSRRVFGERRLIANMKAFIEEPTNRDVYGRLPINGEFKVVNGTDLTLVQQINIFNKASIVIGPHGAGLTNIMFMKKGSLVMEFPVRHAKLLYFKYLALVSHLHYYEIKELFTYADLDYHITDHSIDVVKSYIYSGNELLNNGGEIDTNKMDL